jgi:hypothetical protein
MKMTMEDIQRQYAEHCAKLGEAVYTQRKLHAKAEHHIRELERLEQEARQLEAPAPAEPTPTEEK